MTNKLRYFVGNWKMFGDLGSFQIIRKINQFKIAIFMKTMDPLQVQ